VEPSADETPEEAPAEVRELRERRRPSR
jgi:hypothetical protein